MANARLRDVLRVPRDNVASRCGSSDQLRWQGRQRRKSKSPGRGNLGNFLERQEHDVYLGNRQEHEDLVFSSFVVL